MGVEPARFAFDYGFVPEPEIAEKLALASAFQETAVGAAYWKDVSTISGKYLSAAFGSCRGKQAQPTTHLVLEVNAKGHVDRLLVSGDAPLSVCLRKHLDAKNWPRLPKPAATPTYLRFAVETPGPGGR